MSEKQSIVVTLVERDGSVFRDQHDNVLDVTLGDSGALIVFTPDHTYCYAPGSWLRSITSHWRED